MATLTTIDLSLPNAAQEHERRIIEANRKLAEAGIVRWDFKHLPDGMQRFLKAIHRMESKS